MVPYTAMEEPKRAKREFFLVGHEETEYEPVNARDSVPPESTF